LQDQTIEKEKWALNCLRDLSEEEAQIECSEKDKLGFNKFNNDDSINLSRNFEFYYLMLI